MGKLGTKNVNDEPKEGVAKTLKPGNVSAKINSIKLEPIKWKEGAYNIVLNLEGPDLGDDFEGFQIDKDRPELGKARGQVGRVKADKWPFSDGTTKSGIVIERDVEMLKFIKSLCRSIGKLNWFEGVDNKYDTIEDFIKAFDNDAPFRNVWLNWCICGKEYTGKGGYTNYDLYLPKATKQGIPFEMEQVESGKVIQFNPEVHIEKERKSAPVESFGDNNPSNGSIGTGNDISLRENDDFEL
jgi:hypothetical protein